MTDPRFAQSPEHFVQAYSLIQKDVIELFDYIEPAAANHNCYSFRIHALLLRTCVEFEANCRAVLRENGYRGVGDLSIADFKKLEVSHRLSSYCVRIPRWTGGDGSERRPFEAWSNGRRLEWYDVYSATKHDRQQAFAKATFKQLIDAVCGLLAVLSAQFETNEYSQAVEVLALCGSQDGFESAIGGEFKVRFPDDWPLQERYDFNWESLRAETEPFARFDYDALR